MKNDEEGGMYGDGRGAFDGISNGVALSLFMEEGSRTPLVENAGRGRESD